MLAHGGSTLMGNHANTTINSDEDSDVLDDNVPDVPDELKPVNGMYLLIGRSQMLEYYLNF